MLYFILNYGTVHWLIHTIQIYEYLIGIKTIDEQ